MSKDVDSMNKAREAENPFVQQVKNLPFHNFEEESSLTCQVKEKMTLGEKEPFDVYEVIDLLTGEEKFLTSSYTIEKQIEKVGDERPEMVFLFVFRGKTVNAQKQPFNQFDVSTCSLKAYEEYNKKG